LVLERRLTVDIWLSVTANFREMQQVCDGKWLTIKLEMGQAGIKPFVFFCNAPEVKELFMTGIIKGISVRSDS
jgi:hypothetical protein